MRIGHWALATVALGLSFFLLPGGANLALGVHVSPQPVAGLAISVVGFELWLISYAIARKHAAPTAFRVLLLIVMAVSFIGVGAAALIGAWSDEERFFFVGFTISVLASVLGYRLFLRPREGS